MKRLIAYFSRWGNNYVGGRIVNLPIGNTEVVANSIRELIGGDLFRIDTRHTYPEDYEEATAVAKRELSEKARPEIKGHVDAIDQYDVIFLGYPNWWGTMPMAVWTFLESHDFAGKTIVPFCTHEGSGMGRSESDIKKTCPKATLRKGLPLRGSDVQSAKNDIAAWLKKLELGD